MKKKEKKERIWRKRLGESKKDEERIGRKMRKRRNVMTGKGLDVNGRP